MNPEAIRALIQRLERELDELEDASSEIPVMYVVGAVVGVKRCIAILRQHLEKS